MREKETRNQMSYDRIKVELQRGDYMPGERLLGDELARKYGTSSTPVRMGFSRLQGERMVEAFADDGFHAPLVTETSMRDIFQVNLHQLRLCVSLVKSEGNHNGDLDLDQLKTLDVVSATEKVFQSIASATGNAELIAIIANLNDRLHLIRLLKDNLLPSRDVEILRLAERWIARDFTTVNALLRDYHRRRLDRLRDIVLRVHRPRDHVA